jgi:hypothetical protein
VGRDTIRATGLRSTEGKITLHFEKRRGRENETCPHMEIIKDVLDSISSIFGTYEYPGLGPEWRGKEKGSNCPS